MSSRRLRARPTVTIAALILSGIVAGGCNRAQREPAGSHADVKPQPSRLAASAADQDLIVIGHVGSITATPGPLAEKPEEAPYSALSDASDQLAHAVLRGPQDWHEFDYPANWYVLDHSDTCIQSYDPMQEERVFRELADAGRLCLRSGSYDDVFEGDWPPGTVTDTVTIDGVAATRYTPPTSAEDGEISGWAVIDLMVPGSPARGTKSTAYHIERSVGIAGDQAKYDGWVAALDGILDSLNFIDDHIDSRDWQRPLQKDPQLPGIRQYRVELPAGWNVTENPHTVIVSSPTTPTAPYTVGHVSLAFEPGVPVSEWESGEEAWGDSRVRRVLGSEVIAGGRRTTQYVLRHDPPVKITVSVPDLPVGSPEYWLYEQTAWRAMHRTCFWHEPETAYP